MPPKNPKEEETAAAAAPAAEPVPEKGAGKKEKPSAKGGKEPKEGKDGKEGKPGKGGKGAAAETKAKKFVPDNPNFRYIVRLAGSDLDGTRATGLALTGVRGVGPRISEVTCRLAGVNAAERIGNLPEATVEAIEQTLGSLRDKLPPWMINHRIDYVTGEARHYFGADLETARRDDINQMRMVRSYKGVRHERGQKVRGQRTRSNGRTGMAAGVLKKDAKAAAAAKAAEGGGAAAAPAAAAPAAEEKKA
jgi:small subunit ribosomal protein S13